MPWKFVGALLRRSSAISPEGESVNIPKPPRITVLEFGERLEVEADTGKNACLLLPCKGTIAAGVDESTTSRRSGYTAALRLPVPVASEATGNARSWKQSVWQTGLELRSTRRPAVIVRFGQDLERLLDICAFVVE